MRLRDAYKKYILQKKWVKKAIPALSSGQSNLQTPIGGCHRQLDDQNRNPNINNRDHLVGQLTTPPPPFTDKIRKVVFEVFPNLQYKALK